MLREIHAIGKLGVLLALRPKQPAVGELAKFVFKVAPINADGMDVDETKALEIVMSRITIFAMDRQQEPEPRYYTLTPLPEKGAYSFAMRIRKNVDHRVIVAVTAKGGKDLETSYDFQTQPAKAEAHAEALPGLDEQGHLEMSAQHETMQAMGRHWTEAWRELEKKNPRWRALTNHVEAVHKLQSNLEHFHLHKFAERKAEFDVLARTFGEQLKTLHDAVQRRDREGAWQGFKRIDQQSCLKCHLVFRWGAVQDFKQVPELNHEKHR